MVAYGSVWYSFLSILRLMENMRPKSRPQLDRDAWIAEAIEVLAAEGVAGLRVEVLAKRLGVTKGSFYWHFKDRQDLLDEALTVWKEGRIRDIVKQTSVPPGQEAQQILHLIEVYSASRSRKGMLIELAVRDWAKRDAAVAAVVSEVDACRFKCARDLFLKCGLTVREASSRSLLLYAYVFGQSLMVVDQFDQSIDTLKSDIMEMIAGDANRNVVSQD